jgi:stage 0 sporulation regulatory protein
LKAAQIGGLLLEIETCRDEMVQLASETSLANQRVIAASRKLDRLLNEFNQYAK